MDQLSFLRRTLLESAQNFTLETIIKPYGPKKVIKLRRDRRLGPFWQFFRTFVNSSYCFDRKVL